MPAPIEYDPIIGSSSPDAIALGRLVDRRRGIAQRIRYGGDQHVLLFGPNGKGKGVRILLTNLLSMSGSSLIVVDPKGECAAVTAPYRRTLGRVVILNPFGVLTDIPGYEDLKSTGFNPLAALDPTSDMFNSQAAQIADALVMVEGKDPHWGQSARALIAAIIMYVAIEARKGNSAPTMMRVRELLCAASSEAHAANGFEGTGIPKMALDMMRSELTGLRNKASQFVEWTKEIQSVASTAKIQTEPFDDPPISRDMEQEGFDFATLKREPITVYLILPPTEMDRHSKWLRLVLTSAIQAVLRPRQPGEPKTVFMLDEFFALGHLEIISTVWSLVRGYGVQIIPVLQDLNQLKMLHKDMWETFIGMAGAVMSFAPNDMTTAKWLSERAGETTRDVTTSSTSTSESTSTGQTAPQPQNPLGGSSTGTTTSTSTSSNTSPTKTNLLTPHRIIGLKTGFMLLTLDGLAPVVSTYAPAYYEIITLRERARKNPYYVKKANVA